MKTDIFRNALLSGVILLLIPVLNANPFATKEAIPTPKKGLKLLDELSYTGYAFSGNQRFAIVQIGSEQHTLTAGERLQDVTILKIDADYILYQKGQETIKLRRTSIPMGTTSGFGLLPDDAGATAAQDGNNYKQ